MKIKLDENIPARLAAELRKLFHQTDTVFDEDLAGCNDPVLWDECQKSGRFLITQDLDFSDLRHFVPGTHWGILLVRLKNPSRNTIVKKILQVFKEEDASSWIGCFVVVTERKLRVSRPQDGQMTKKH